jgi:hypothetical protein
MMPILPAEPWHYATSALLAVTGVEDPRSSADRLLLVEQF